MPFLRSIARRASMPDGRFPFDVPVLRNLSTLEVSPSVTLLVGENGTGKSTFMEALACAAGSVAVGSDGVDRDRTLDLVRPVAKHLSLTWSKRTHKGFFLRAEDFFGYAKRLAQMRAEAAEDVKRVDAEYAGRSELAKSLAKGVHQKTIGELQQRYGDGLDTQSHGESFLTLFQSRLVPDGLYLLDEPEAPLSPLRQLAFLSLIKQMLTERCQFIIATHSPIILAFPGATILSCDSGELTQVEYEDLEHVTLTRAFLNDPERYLRGL